MLVLKWMLLLAIASPVLAWIAGQLGLLSGKQPGDLGVRDGKLKRPSRTANCVSSQTGLWPHDAAPAAAIEPLRVADFADGGDPMAHVAKAIETMPGARLVAVRNDYVYAQFTTKLLKYVDDDGTDPTLTLACRSLGSSDRRLAQPSIDALRWLVTAASAGRR